MNRLAFIYSGFIIFFFLPATLVKAQAQHFRNPLDIPIRLSANFGDIREDHFDTGIDIRTNEKIGYKVYAAADGYVSRIKVSPYGYGKVLYITHPGGFITVYGHLDHFNSSIDKYVRDHQYAAKKFDVEMFPNANLFTVKEGDLIAISGNSGGSSGPHLHFEIRDGSGETYPLNPEKFLNIADTIAPRFNNLFIYPLSLCCTHIPPHQYGVTATDSEAITVPDTIVVNDMNIGFGVDAEDFMNGSGSDLGVYRLQGAVDGTSYFSMKLDRLRFDNGRYVNAHVDYRFWQQSDTIVRRLFLLPGDHNSIYDLANSAGKILLSDTLVHHVNISASDENGNTTNLNFFVKYSGLYQAPDSTTAFSSLFKAGDPNSFDADSIRLRLTANALYDDLNFNYSITETGSDNYLTAIHHIHNPFTPLQEAATLQLLARPIPDSLKTKTVVVYRNQRRRLSALSTHWEGDFITAKIRDFGDYFAMLDTLPPVISVIGLRQNSYLKRKSIHFVAADNLSGISSYNGYLDGKWILLEYNPKANQLICNLDLPLNPGNHKLKIDAADEVNNRTAYTFKFKK